jgi:hypothetical protein
VVGMIVGIVDGASVVGSIAVGPKVGIAVGEPVVGSDGDGDGKGVRTGLGGSMHGPQ